MPCSLLLFKVIFVFKDAHIFVRGLRGKKTSVRLRLRRSYPKYRISHLPTVPRADQSRCPLRRCTFLQDFFKHVLAEDAYMLPTHSKLSYFCPLYTIKPTKPGPESRLDSERRTLSGFKSLLPGLSARAGPASDPKKAPRARAFGSTGPGRTGAVAHGCLSVEDFLSLSLWT